MGSTFKICKTFIAYNKNICYNIYIKQIVKEKEIKNTSNYIKISIALILLGVVFALIDYFKADYVYKFWPIIIIFLGVGFIRIFLLRPRKEAIFLGIGIYLLLFSCSALYFNFYGWKQLKFFWPLFITFLGISFTVIFFFKQQYKMYLLLGLILISISAVFFIIFSFELQIWWITFILLGLSILIAGKSIE